MTPEPVHCARCHRLLRSPRSIARKYGAWCWARNRAEAVAKALAGFTADQIAKAWELVELGGLVATRHARVFWAVASNGIDRYLTHPDGCNCKSGLHGLRCYHSAGARILTTGSRA